LPKKNQGPLFQLVVIFYRIGDAAIEIVRVIDGRRNLAAFFPSDHSD
jgi:hypothetical protein